MAFVATNFHKVITQDLSRARLIPSFEAFAVGAAYALSRSLTGPSGRFVKGASADQWTINISTPLRTGRGVLCCLGFDGCR